MRMVVRVHRDTARLRTASEPAAAACLADGDVLMLEVADLADRRTAVDVHAADLAGRHAQERIVAFLCHELCRRARAADELCALADLQLDGMDDRTERDVLQRECVARLDVRLGTRLHDIADLEAVRCEDIALLAVCIVQESNTCAAVRIVLDRRHTGGDAVLRALKINDAVEALVSAAAMAYGQLALLVAAARLGEADGQGLLRLVRRDLIEGRDRHETSAGRIRLKSFYCHVRTFLSSQPSKNSIVSPGASFTMAFL